MNEKFSEIPSTGEIKFYHSLIFIKNTNTMTCETQSKAAMNGMGKSTQNKNLSRQLLLTINMEKHLPLEARNSSTHSNDFEMLQDITRTDIRYLSGNFKDCIIV